MRPMTLEEFQQESIRTMSFSQDSSVAQLTCALGLCEEAGEAGSLIKKFISHGHQLDQEKLTKELGDVLWYLSAVATLNAISLDDVAKTNVEKLKKRYPNGFKTEDSIKRIDANE